MVSMAGWLVGWLEIGPERAGEAQRGTERSLSGPLWATLGLPTVTPDPSPENYVCVYVCSGIGSMQANSASLKAKQLRNCLSRHVYVCMNPANLRVSRFVRQRPQYEVSMNGSFAARASWQKSPSICLYASSLSFKFKTKK